MCVKKTLKVCRTGRSDFQKLSQGCHSAGMSIYLSGRREGMGLIPFGKEEQEDEDETDTMYVGKKRRSPAEVLIRVLF